MPRASEALQIILDSVATVKRCEVALPEALGRVLALDVRSRHDVPQFANSAMDGYAVRAADVEHATASAPVRLGVLEDVPAGSMPTQSVGEGGAIRIMTGAAMPEGADCVVRVEDTSSDGPWVLIVRGVRQGVNVRCAGEDVRAGQVCPHELRRLSAIAQRSEILRNTRHDAACCTPHLSPSQSWVAPVFTSIASAS